MHSNERPHQCSLCVKAFKLSYDLKKHIQIVHSNHQYECAICKKIFKNRRNWKQHEKNHIDVQEVDESQSQMIRTKLIDEEPFHCKFCNKRFVLEAQLNAHIKIHDDDERYWCKICNISYVRLERHSRIANIVKKVFKRRRIENT